jgi:hypothetical protein
MPTATKHAPPATTPLERTAAAIAETEAQLAAAEAEQHEALGPRRAELLQLIDKLMVGLDDLKTRHRRLEQEHAAELVKAAQDQAWEALGAARVAAADRFEQARQELTEALAEVEAVDRRCRVEASRPALSEPLPPQAALRCRLEVTPDGRLFVRRID